MARSGSHGLFVGGCLALFSVLAAGAHEIISTNDNFGYASVLTGMSNDVAGNNSKASSEPGEPAHAGAPASRSLWWSWQAPVTGTFYFSTSGSTFDTLLAIYTGDALLNL